MFVCHRQGAAPFPTPLYSQPPLPTAASQPLATEAQSTLLRVPLFAEWILCDVPSGTERSATVTEPITLGDSCKVCAFQATHVFALPAHAVAE